jgi:Zn-finger nucleic acid-binding protein
MADAGALHCPNCGGPAVPGDAACKYCHATLATISCPACFALMFDGAIYCPACGARRARTAGTGLQAPCPACRGTLRDVRIGETALLECERCRGVWIDAATFEHLCANREAQAAVLHLAPSAAVPAAAAVHYRKCVACGKLMNRLNFGRLSGTIADVCRGHGTFLDAGELHRIVRFIEGGGLERARQRQLDDLKDEERRLRAAQSGHETSGGDGTPGSVWSAVDLLSLLHDLTQK